MTGVSANMTRIFSCFRKSTRKSQLSLAIVAICLLPSCSILEAKFANGDEQGTAIARSVKAELVKSPIVDAAPLRVRVDGTSIVLEGFVESLVESQEAESLVRALYPEYNVFNTITVR